MQPSLDKVIIFDFDGTIAETLVPVIAILNRLSSEFGYRKIVEEDIINFRNRRSQDIFQDWHVPLYKLPFIISKTKKELNKEISSIRPYPDMIKIARALKQAGYNLGVLTSNSKDTVEKFLQQNQLEIFDFIYSSSIFGKGKSLNAIIKEKNLNPEKVIYIGDETRDIDAAKFAKIKVIAVTWGIHSKELLAKQKPDYIIDKPRDILDILLN